MKDLRAKAETLALNHSKRTRSNMDGSPYADQIAMDDFIAGYLAHAKECEQAFKELKVVSNREISKHVAHPQAVWFSEWVMEPLRDIIAAYEKGMG